jgi:DNA-binding NarL/FixJ family response regulator
MTMLRKASVLVVDPEPVARCGLVQLINSHPELRVCGEAETVGQTRDFCAHLKPEVLVFDPALTDGFSLVKELRRWSARTHVVVFTALEDAISVQRAFKAGVCGYVTRRDPVEALMTAILDARSGGRHVGPRVEHLLLEKLATGSVEMRENEIASLSDRELQVFRLVGIGSNTRAIAEELHLSVKTVETHRYRIREKLHLGDSAELQRRAVLFCEHENGTSG